MLELPGGPLATRPLHFFFIADCSSSMMGTKIESLNTALESAIPCMRDVASGNPNASVLVRAVRFNSEAQWHVPQPTDVHEFQWPRLRASGATAMGHALRLVAEQMKSPPMPARALPPVLVLVSDGEPTDDFTSGLKALMNEPWGLKAVRIGIAIGRDANLEVLQRFIGHPEIAPLQANNAEALVDSILWASTAVLQAASAPASQIATADHLMGMNVPLSMPTHQPSSSTDVW